MEIERKFKINRIPEGIEQCEKWEIEQGYLCEKGCTLRVRKNNDKYYLTLKMRLRVGDVAALVNREEEFEINQEAYDHLVAKADGNRIVKTRYRIPIAGGLVAELDCFHGKLEGLCFVEVEFPSVEMSELFVKPDWFAEEVSKDPYYRNSHLIHVEL